MKSKTCYIFDNIVNINDLDPDKIVVADVVFIIFLWCP